MVRKIYCGNNSLDSSLTNNTSILGTRYKCMKRGIGVGMNLKYDPKYNQEYDPIDTTRIYCGDKNELPEGYDRFGSLPRCLQKGVGVGKIITAKKVQKSNKLKKQGKYKFIGINMTHNKSVYIYAILLAISIFIVMYIKKPSYVVKLKDDKLTIDWKRFFLLYTLFCVIIFIVMFLFFNILKLKLE
jgi:hypothetical protein